MKKGKYQIYKVGKEKVIATTRAKIIQYAKKKGVQKIEYKMSVDNLKDIGEDYISIN